ncbi:MAG: hypothetical protein A2126_02310 [Candidatus Woykebacteria bacterium GWB1_45_5]|uniref:Uncharacterized protein n=2 Tax=Candidatus Woykeibacteriota TaxID=1817899 RepID=A0A1G1W0Y5_9BACT|nr:MAG: hypothetical protein A2113_00330 [Candidatus Woykebacteria bacterium GWA1_44_8]OGY23659.1 MAG: hypothetical protein A2126_02310 [Candidatus Woykebacteria bacterium GWB1_45_5]
MKSSGLKIGAFVLIAALIAIGGKIIATTPFFSDTETSAGNTLQVSDIFPQSAPLYNSNPYTCSGGASNTAGPTFGSVVIGKDNGKVIVDATLQGATASSTYDIWVNQDPGGCPLSQPTAPGALTTNSSGNGTAHVEVNLVSGATKFWISAVGGGQVLRSTAVSF